jgi:hypothetical protein
MKNTMVSIFAGALLMATGSFAADEKEGKIQQRKENQQERIAQGVKSGSLTPAETAHIERQASKVNKEVRRDRKQNDGKLTPQEKARINRQQNKLSKEIAKQKHDGQTQK